MVSVSLRLTKRRSCTSSTWGRGSTRTLMTPPPRTVVPQHPGSSSRKRGGGFRVDGVQLQAWVLWLLRHAHRIGGRETRRATWCDEREDEPSALVRIQLAAGTSRDCRTTSPMEFWQAPGWERMSSSVSSTQVFGQSHRASVMMDTHPLLQDGRGPVNLASPSAPRAATTRSSVRGGTLML